MTSSSLSSRGIAAAAVQSAIIILSRVRTMEAVVAWRDFRRRMSEVTNKTRVFVAFALVVTGAVAMERARRRASVGRELATRRTRAKKRRELKQLLARAVTYEEFEFVANELERLDEDDANEGAMDGNGGRLNAREWASGSRAYDVDLIEEQLRQLRTQRAAGNVEEMMFLLRADILRNLGSVTSPSRVSVSADATSSFGVPRAVREYISEIKTQLRMIAEDDQVTIQEKLVFLQETRHCFGRTALMMSGGGTLGTFHVGVARALNRRHLLPRVLAGSSVGSIVAAIIASRTQEELDEFFSDEHFWDLLPDLTFFSGNDPLSALKHYMRTGALHDIDFFQRCLRALFGDLTFQEAYDRSGGRILSVCVCATRPGEKPRLLNYLTSPHVVLWSAVAASCAFPSLFPPQPLLAKSRNGAFVPWQPEGKLGPRRWRDGSLEADLPMDGLRELFNCNYFVVSQTNPHIVPILRVKRWFASRSRFFAMCAYLVETEWKHRCHQVLDLVPQIDVFDLFKLFGQQWEGDATAVMWYTWKQFSRIASNPTKDYLFETATMGEKEIWPKLAAIEHACGIELVLDECVATLRHKFGSKGRMSARGRVPSWNMVNFASRGSYEHMHAQRRASTSGDASAVAVVPPSPSSLKFSKSSSVASLIYSDDAADDDSIAPNDIIAAALGASEDDIRRATFEFDSRRP